jgi:hypothetical protein
MSGASDGLSRIGRTGSSAVRLSKTRSVTSVENPLHRVQLALNAVQRALDEGRPALKLTRVRLHAGRVNLTAGRVHPARSKPHGREYQAFAGARSSLMGNSRKDAAADALAGYQKEGSPYNGLPLYA